MKGTMTDSDGAKGFTGNRDPYYTVKKRPKSGATHQARKIRVRAVRAGIRELNDSTPFAVRAVLSSPSLTKDYFSPFEWDILRARYPFSPFEGWWRPQSSQMVNRSVGVKGPSQNDTRAESEAKAMAKVHDLAAVYAECHGRGRHSMTCGGIHHRWTMWKLGKGPKPHPEELKLRRDIMRKRPPIKGRRPAVKNMTVREPVGKYVELIEFAEPGADGPGGADFADDGTGDPSRPVRSTSCGPWRCCSGPRVWAPRWPTLLANSQRPFAKRDGRPRWSALERPPSRCCSHSS
jgi:hypothetical protein